MTSPVAKKRFGQHFLEEPWARKVVEAIAPTPTDTVLEIGPGPGAITRPLAARVRALLACEIDRDLAAAMRADSPSNVRVLEQDVLTTSANSLRQALGEELPAGTSLRVAGNLPYNIASPILFHLVALCDEGLPIQDATVMLQREVADRLLAQPGTREYGVLSVLIGHRAHVSPRLQLPPGAFRPPPKVRSSVVQLRFHPPTPAVQNPARLAEVVQAIFSRRRKQLGNALQAFRGFTADEAVATLDAAAIAADRRPETLSIPECCRLADATHTRRP